MLSILNPLRLFTVLAFMLYAWRTVLWELSNWRAAVTAIELTLIIMLVSAVLAVAEAASPDTVNSQPHLLTVAGLIGFAAVANYISEPLFWTLLVGLFGFARLVKKRDYVSSALFAAVLSAVGEPWEDEDAGAINRVPVPLLCAALAIGIRVAAKWAGYRHLTWMIV
ncbi:hypothetical protein Sango_0003000 [Sesamum angolense]|uniref:Uncharacterized protein n=1 Tax=Sesamum angolense TaxID=2727404 RepID=A0AAE1XCL9_9LAMI|nr:hypothetical protein Sango_0003000 [Sesamum angolense]